MSASRAVLLPTGMAMTFSIGRPVAAPDPTSATWTRDDEETAPEPRAARVIAIRDGKPFDDDC